MEGPLNEQVLFWVIQLKDKPHIVRRYNVPINTFQFQRGNGKQPLALTFSLSSRNVMFSDSVEECV